MNRLLSRRFTWPYFLWKKLKKKSKMPSAAAVISAFKVKLVWWEKSISRMIAENPVSHRYSSNISIIGISTYIRCHLESLPPDKWGFQIILFLFLHVNMYCGFSLEVPHRGASNEYPQYMLSWSYKKNINTFWLKQVPYLELFWSTGMTIIWLFLCELINMTCVMQKWVLVLMWQQNTKSDWAHM